MDDYEYKNLLLTMGLKLSFYRKKAGLTQEELAERTNLSTTYIGMLEAPNISKTPSLKTLYTISKVLDIPLYKLLTPE